MVDIETLGTASNAALLSLAAVYFDLDSGETGSKFHLNINLQSCLDIGLKVDGDTFYWWLNKSYAAQEQVMAERKSLQEALFRFSEFVLPESRLWANSPHFDLTILENAYAACSIQKPWNHFLEMDVRTLVAFNPGIKKDMQYEGTKHNPLDDCLHQIRYVTEIWKTINWQKN